MCLGEEDFGEMLLLLRRVQIEPLERSVDIGEGKDAIWISIIQSLGGRLVSYDTRNKGRAALDDIILRFASLQRVLFFRRWRRCCKCGVSVAKLRGGDTRFQECGGFFERVKADQRQFDAAGGW